MDGMNIKSCNDDFYVEFFDIKRSIDSFEVISIFVYQINVFDGYVKMLSTLFMYLDVIMIAF